MEMYRYTIATMLLRRVPDGTDAGDTVKVAEATMQTTQPWDPDNPETRARVEHIAGHMFCGVVDDDDTADHAVMSIVEVRNAADVLIQELSL